MQLSFEDAEYAGKRKRTRREIFLTEQAEYAKARIRAFVEHPFRVIKRQFGYNKVRFKGLAKNTAQVMTLFSLSNLWMVRKKLLSMTGEFRPLMINLE